MWQEQWNHGFQLLGTGKISGDPNVGQHLRDKWVMVKFLSTSF